MPGVVLDLQKIREKVAETVYVDYDFGRRIEDSDGWVFNAPNRLERTVYLDDGSASTYRLCFFVLFKPHTAEVLDKGLE